MSVILIESILGGITPTSHFAGKGQFRAGFGIDPSQPIDDADTAFSTVSSGLLRPTPSQDISSSALNAAPLWMLTNPKNTNVYVVDALNSMYTIDGAFSSFAGVSDGGSLSNGRGNGFEYYDNYLYDFKNTTVARYGPLNGTPAFDGDYWVTTLGKTALQDTTYPSTVLNGIQYPNHVAKRHSNGKLYFADVVGNNGTLHYIQTTKTTVEGDTDNGSTYGALTLGYGLYPTDIESWNEGMVISIFEGTATTPSVRQARAKLAFWDDTSTNINKIVWVEHPDTYISAIRNVGGSLITFSGNINAQGYRVMRFVGGYSFEEIYHSATGEPPLPGAVDGILNQILFGSYTNSPTNDGVCMSIGLNAQKLSSGVFPIMRSTGGNSSTIVTSVLVADNSNMNFISPILGWSKGSGTSNNGIDYQSGAYNNAPSMFWSETYRIGRPFRIQKIRIPFANTLSATRSIIPKLYFDDGNSSYTCTTIDNTTFPNQRYAEIKIPSGIGGFNNFFLELKWTGSQVLTVALPIEIIYETIEENG